jgi:hypothetical protein
MKKLRTLGIGILLLVTPFYCSADSTSTNTAEQTIIQTNSDLSQTDAKTEPSSLFEYIASLINNIVTAIKQTFAQIQNYFTSTPSTPNQPHTKTVKNNNESFIVPPTIEEESPQEVATQNNLRTAIVIAHHKTLPEQHTAPDNEGQEEQEPQKKLLALIPATKNLSLGDSLFESLHNSFTQLKEQKYIEGVDEIDSPAVQTEKLQPQKKAVSNIITKSKQLDTFIKQLPRNQQSQWIEKQVQLLTPTNKKLLKQALAQEVHHNWQHYGKNIIQSSLSAVKTGMISAAVGLIVQGAQIGTGNLLMLDTNALLITGLTSTIGAAMHALSSYAHQSPTTNTFVASAGAKALSESSLIPYFQRAQNIRYKLTVPSFTGPIINWITYEAIAIATEMLEKNGEIFKTMNTINLKHALIIRPSSDTHNELVAAIVPRVQAIVRNEKIASILTQIGWISLKSAAIGGLLYAMGLGYADSSSLESVGYATLTGLAHGTVGALTAVTQKIEPGALITIATTPLAMLKVVNATPQAAVTATIQVVTEEVTNLLINESEKAGGLLQTLKKGGESLGNAISSRWSHMWANISDAFETLQEIEPLPI